MAHPLLLRLLDGGDLLCHHREHLNIDAIELIEAGPGPRTKRGENMRGTGVQNPSGTSQAPADFARGGNPQW